MSLSQEQAARLRLLIAQNEVARTRETYKRIQTYIESLTDRSNDATETDEAEANGYDPNPAAW